MPLFEHLEEGNIVDKESREHAVAILLKHDLYIRKLIGKFSQRYYGLIDSDDREDIATDVKIEIMQGAFDKFRGECSEESYLFMIARYTFIDYLRKKIAKREEIDMDFPFDNQLSKNIHPGQHHSDNSPENLLLKKEIEEIIRDEVDTMKPVKRAIYKMIRIDGMKQKNISKSLNRVQATISEHWKNIKRQLEQVLQKKFPDETIDIQSILKDINHVREI